NFRLIGIQLDVFKICDLFPLTMVTLNIERPADTTEMPTTRRKALHALYYSLVVLAVVIGLIFIFKPDLFFDTRRPFDKKN
ncbi:hypothetical protein PMAYCL1PPCAC_09682, partial [Pristionchus mayeri]